MVNLTQYIVFGIVKLDKFSLNSEKTVTLNHDNVVIIFDFMRFKPLFDVLGGSNINNIIILY